VVCRIGSLLCCKEIFSVFSPTFVFTSILRFCPLRSSTWSIVLQPESSIFSPPFRSFCSAWFSTCRLYFCPLLLYFFLIMLPLRIGTSPLVLTLGRGARVFPSQTVSSLLWFALVPAAVGGRLVGQSVVLHIHLRCVGVTLLLACTIGPSLGSFFLGDLGYVLLRLSVVRPSFSFQRSPYVFSL